MKNYIILLIAFCLVSHIIVAQRNQDVYTYTVGDYKVSMLSENQGNGKSDILIGATAEMLAEYTDNGTFPNAVNAFLIQTPDKNILIDAGFGSKLFDNLQTLGVSPEQIDIILLTHMHGDHIGGLLKDNTVTFPKAILYIPQPEYDYWMNTANDQARKVIDAYKNQLKLFTPSPVNGNLSGLFPGVTAIAAYGHTPGHTAFLLESGNKQFLVWGDLTHAMAIQMPHPEIAVTYDVNPQDAIESRKQILKYVTEKNIPIAGMHIAYPAIGSVKPTNTGGYQFIPAN